MSRSRKSRFLVRYLWLLMLFAVAAVGCGCAEPHVLMLFRTVDGVLLLQRLAVGVLNPMC